MYFVHQKKNGKIQAISVTPKQIIYARGMPGRWGKASHISTKRAIGGSAVIIGVGAYGAHKYHQAHSGNDQENTFHHTTRKLGS